MDLGHANSPPPAEEGPLTGTMHVYRNHHLSEPGAGARPPLGAAFVDRHLAIIDPLLIHPLLPELLPSGEHFREA